MLVLAPSLSILSMIIIIIFTTILYTLYNKYKVLSICAYSFPLSLWLSLSLSLCVCVALPLPPPLPPPSPLGTLIPPPPWTRRHLCSVI
jgi:hypothetical protein